MREPKVGEIWRGIVERDLIKVVAVGGTVDHGEVNWRQEPDPDSTRPRIGIAYDLFLKYFEPVE